MERGKPIVAVTKHPVNGNASVTIIMNGQEVATDNLPEIAWNVIEGKLEIVASFEIFPMERK